MGPMAGPGKSEFSRQKAMAVERSGETSYKALLRNVRAEQSLLCRKTLGADGAGAQDTVVKTW